MKTIVVGIDGSEGAEKALAFALAEAGIHQAAVKAVSAWSVPASVYASGMTPVMVDPADFENAAKDALDSSLERAGAAKAGVSVTPIVREGHPADVLVAESADADLLVVGSRGLGGFRGLLLGSVGQECAHHATCPVTIVPVGDRNAQ